MGVGSVPAKMLRQAADLASIVPCCAPREGWRGDGSAVRGLPASRTPTLCREEPAAFPAAAGSPAASTRIAAVRLRMEKTTGPLEGQTVFGEGTGCLPCKGRAR